MIDLNLPDPGGRRYWQITDQRGTLQLELREAHGSLVSSQQLFVYGDGDEDQEIINVVREASTQLLTQAKLKSLIGTYKFEGDN